MRYVSNLCALAFTWTNIWKLFRHLSHPQLHILSVQLGWMIEFLQQNTIKWTVLPLYQEFPATKSPFEMEINITGVDESICLAYYTISLLIIYNLSGDLITVALRVNLLEHNLSYYVIYKLFCSSTRVFYPMDQFILHMIVSSFPSTRFIILDTFSDFPHEFLTLLSR